MIGSHDSFTYRSPSNRLYSLVKMFWRTQNKTLEEQYAAGVRYFDIRVREYGNIWQACHGLVNLDVYYQSLNHLVITLKERFPEINIRLILEKGNTEKFISEIYWIKDYSYVKFIAIKKDWIVIKNEDPEIKDYSYIPWHSGWTFWTNVYYLLTHLSTIKSWSKKHNPTINSTLINSSTLYFMDYV